MLKPNAEYTETDYGFLLVYETEDEYIVEVFGMVGVGRFELATSCSYAKDENLDEVVGDLVCDEECIDNMLLYIETKKALKAVFSDPS